MNTLLETCVNKRFIRLAALSWHYGRDHEKASNRQSGTRGGYRDLNYISHWRRSFEIEDSNKLAARSSLCYGNLAKESVGSDTYSFERSYRSPRCDRSCCRRMDTWVMQKRRAE